MITIRKSADRGHANHGWLDSYHTFSFADYHDPAHVHFRSLRVINDDRIAAGAGFPTHPHRDMEIITYVIEGSLQHRDSMGNGSTIDPGEVQRMTAGRGLTHSEFNHSQMEGLRLLQIWILPREHGLTPGYEQKRFSTSDRQGTLRMVASPDGADGSLTIHQDVRLYASLLAPGESVVHALATSRHAWIQVARGSIEVNGLRLDEGDGAGVSDETALAINGQDDAEFLLFDLA